jgi:hypothetical protein
MYTDGRRNAGENRGSIRGSLLRQHSCHDAYASGHGQIVLYGVQVALADANIEIGFHSFLRLLRQPD